MRRLLGAIGICFFIALIFTNSLGFNFATAFGALCFVVAVILNFRPFGIDRRLSWFPFVSFAACAIYCLSVLLYVQPTLVLEGKQAEITAEIIEADGNTGGSYYVYTVKTESVMLEGAPQKLKITLYSQTPIDCAEGDKISCSVYFAGLGDAKARYYARNIYLKAYASRLSVVGKEDAGFTLNSFAAKLRNGVVEFTGLNVRHQESSVILGTSFGSRYLTDELNEIFKYCGVSHLFSVSGLHISIIGQMLMMTLGFFGIKKRHSCVVSVFAVWFFVFIIGFPFSAIRSCVMFTIYAAGILLFRDSDALNSLGFSLMVIAIFAPFSALDVGLLSSASSCLGIILFSKPVYHLIRRGIFAKAGKNGIFDYVLKSFAVTFSAIFLLLPCVILYYGSLSLIAPLANLFLVPLSFVLLFCALIGVIILAVPILNLLAPVFFFIAAIAAKIMILTASALAKIPYANVDVGYTYIAVWIGCCLVMSAVTLLVIYQSRNKKRPVCFCTVLCIAALLCGMVSNAVFYRNVTEIIVVDVGQGSAVLVCSGGKAVQIGCAGSGVSYRVAALLKARGIRGLETLLITDDDSSQEKQVASLASRVSVDALIVPDIAGEIRFDCYQDCDYISDDVILINPWTGCEIEYLDRQRVVQITIGKTRCAVALKKSSVSELEGAFSAVISTSNIPSGISQADCGMFVVSADEAHSAAAVSKLGVYGVDTYATRSSGSLALKTRGKGDLSARRLKDA